MITHQDFCLKETAQTHYFVLHDVKNLKIIMIYLIYNRFFEEEITVNVK
jgi:hypothetical protein